MQTLKKFYFGKSKSKPFISTWKTDNISAGSSTATQVKLPLIPGGSYNFVVEWGDGTQSTITVWNQAQVTKTYSVAGTYTITIKGKCNGWSFGDAGDKLKILSVSKWGNLILGTTQGFYFAGCSNLTLTTVEDILDLSKTTSLLSAFRLCNALTTVNRMNEWDLSSVTNIGSMFESTTLFNQDIGNWNVANVTNMASTFYLARAFNKPVGSWNTGSVVSMRQMFSLAYAFNQPIGNWNVSNVVDMTQMFCATIPGATSFNQDIGAWNVSKVTSFQNMFANLSNNTNPFNNGGSPSINNWVINTSSAVDMSGMFAKSNFNQPIGNWNTIKVVNMSTMFQGAAVFNNGLASGVVGNMLWNLSSVTTTNLMFNGASSFNQNLGALNLPLCTNFTSMFQGASNFNNGGSADINNWVLNTSGSINMQSMFQSATIFNQPVDNWNTSRVTNMTYLFSKATNFNQNIGSWDTSASTSMLGMFSCSFSTAGKFNNGGNTSISTWNTSVCTNMREMFWNQPTFNQPIGSWDTSKVTGMGSMFDTALAFNQNIGSWDISNVTSLSPNFMFAKTAANYSSANLDAIYNGWSSRPVKTPITISFGTAKYTAAGAAGRAILTGAPNNWVITDGGI